MKGLNLEPGLRLATAVSFSPSCSSVSRSAEHGVGAAARDAAGVEPATPRQSQTFLFPNRAGMWKALLQMVPGLTYIPSHAQNLSAKSIWPRALPFPGLQQSESMDSRALCVGLSHLHLLGAGIRLRCPQALAFCPAAQQT